LSRIKDMDVVINATPVGMSPNEEQSPIPKGMLTNRQIVFDAIYKPYETRLLREAKERGARVIHGAEMFLHQGMAQFNLFTGYEAPKETMNRILLSHLLETNN
jgi:shikimate 5-dehydrogenase